MSAPHVAYVVAAYVISAVAIVGLVLDTVLRAGRWRAKAETSDRNTSR